MSAFDDEDGPLTDEDGRISEAECKVIVRDAALFRDQIQTMERLAVELDAHQTVIGRLLRKGATRWLPVEEYGEWADDLRERADWFRELLEEALERVGHGQARRHPRPHERRRHVRARMTRRPDPIATGGHLALCRKLAFLERKRPEAFAAFAALVDALDADLDVLGPSASAHGEPGSAEWAHVDAAFGALAAPEVVRAITAALTAYCIELRRAGRLTQKLEGMRSHIRELLAVGERNEAKE